jgi:hypothetical protein
LLVLKVLAVPSASFFFFLSININNGWQTRLAGRCNEDGSGSSGAGYGGYSASSTKQVCFLKVCDTHTQSIKGLQSGIVKTPFHYRPSEMGYHSTPSARMQMLYAANPPDKNPFATFDKQFKQATFKKQPTVSQPLGRNI